MRKTSTDPVDEEEARAMLDDMEEVYVTRGKRLEHYDLRAESDPEIHDVLMGKILGRSGTLRAPAVRVGARLFVGYNDELLAALRAALDD